MRNALCGALQLKAIAFEIVDAILGMVTGVESGYAQPTMQFLAIPRQE